MRPRCLTCGTWEQERNLQRKRIMRGAAGMEEEIKRLVSFGQVASEVHLSSWLGLGSESLPRLKIEVQVHFEAMSMTEIT